MHRSIRKLHFLRPQRPQGAARLILIGLFVLGVGMFAEGLPVVTALAFVALGATVATVNQRRAGEVAVALHLVVYLSLYFLLAGAVCHAAVRSTGHGISFWAGLDFGASVWPMAEVVRRSVTGMAGGGDTPPVR